MNTIDERMELALEVLQRLKPELEAHSIEVDLPNPAGLSVMPQAFPVRRSPARTAPFLSLNGLLKQLGPQPPCSALVGLCEDGLPFMLNLDDPEPGSILITADPGQGKSRLLHSILTSAAVLNTPDEISSYLITPFPEEHQSFYQDEHFLGVLLPDERAAASLVLDLTAVANQRRSGRENGPVLVLAIDDLPALAQTLDDKEARYLQWLLEYGPQSGVWTLATLEAGRAQRLNRRLLPSFGTRLIGPIASPAMAAAVSGYNDPIAESLEAGQFCVLYGSEWIRFWTISR